MMTIHKLFCLGPTEKTDVSAVDSGSFTLFCSFDVKDLGFILDSGLKLNKQINVFITEELNPS